VIVSPEHALALDHDIGGQSVQNNVSTRCTSLCANQISKSVEKTGISITEASTEM
jgi:hypothetical protein